VSAVVLDRAGAVRRNTRLLMLALAAMQVTFPVMLVVAGPAAKEMTGRTGAVGVLSAVYFVAVGIGAVAFGRWMDRVGRRPGLLVAAVLGAVGGIGSAAAIALGSFWMLLAAAVPFGAASGGANLTRGAVADMHEPDRRGRAVGLLLAVGTIGAVGSPLLVAAIQRVVEDAGRWNPMVAPWVIVPMATAVAFVAYLAVRPDPRDLAIGSEDGEAASARPGRVVRQNPAVRLAIFAAAVGQVAMVGVMTVTPTVLHDHGHGSGAISLIVSAHITGMFAFGPLIGAVMDRFGRHVALIAGFLLSVTGALVAATEASATAVGAGLLLIGLGWSATYLGSTAVISDATEPTERGAALGVMDLVVSAMSAVAGLAGGIVLDLAGYRMLGIVVAVAVTVALVPVVRAGRQVVRAGGPSSVRGAVP
jgi:MFS family permease